MPDRPEPQDPDLYARMREAVLGARELVAQRVASGGWIPTYDDFPQLSSFQRSDMPSISHTSSDLPNYGRLFGSRSAYVTPFAFADVPAFEGLIRFAREHERLRRYLGPPEASMSGDSLDHLYDITVAVRALDLLDRAIHLHGLDFNEDGLIAPYLELEHGLLDQQLPVEIWLPIALTRFEVEELELEGRARLQRIPDPLQLARVPSRIFGGAAHECVVDAATHALVLSGWELKNANVWTMREITLVHEPPEQVDRFLGALRLVAGIETGWRRSSCGRSDGPVTSPLNCRRLRARAWRAATRPGGTGTRG